MMFGCLFSHLHNFASPGGRTRFSFVHPRHVFESLRCNILRPGKPWVKYPNALKLSVALELE